jgi:hypothetical protein
MVPKLVRKPAVLLEDAEGSEILVDVFVPLFLEGYEFLKMRMLCH